MHVQMRLALEFAKSCDVRERRVEEVTRGWRQERERETPGGSSIRGCGFSRRIVERQRIDALLLEPLAAELALAGGRRESSSCERREALRYAEFLPAFLLDLLPA